MHHKSLSHCHHIRFIWLSRQSFCAAEAYFWFKSLATLLEACNWWTSFSSFAQRCAVATVCASPMSPKSSAECRIYEIKDSTVLEFQVGDLGFLYTLVPYGSIIDAEWILFCSSGTVFPAMAFVRRNRSDGRAFPRPRMYTTLAHPVESAC